ncbi:MAG: SRPBCC family protein [Gammaproteobacteria bacterium]|nr:SRPBCC family protein [Gammaproteobacteria bacterium]
MLPGFPINHSPNRLIEANRSQSSGTAFFKPDAADTGRIQIKMYGPEDMPDNEAFEDFCKARATILQEDLSACESVQRGLHSKGYNQGRFIIDQDKQLLSESGVHHFHLMVLRALES